MKSVVKILSLFVWAECLGLLLFLYLFQGRLFQKTIRKLQLVPKVSPRLHAKGSCTVQTTLICPSRLQLNAKRVYAKIPPLPDTPGKVEVPVTLFAPKLCQLASLKPRSCAYTLTPLFARSFPVKVVGIGVNLEEILSQPVMLNPPFVKVVGEEDAIAKAVATVVYITPRDIHQDSFTKEPIVLSDAGKRIKLDLLPKKVNVQLQPFPKIKKEVVVKPAFLNAANAALPVYSYQVFPATVSAKGDPRDVLSLERVRTQPVDLAQLKGKEVEAPLEKIKGVALEPDKVKLIFVLGKKP